MGLARFAFAIKSNTNRASERAEEHICGVLCVLVVVVSNIVWCVRLAVVSSFLFSNRGCTQLMREHTHERTNIHYLYELLMFGQQHRSPNSQRRSTEATHVLCLCVCEVLIILARVV